MRQVICDICGCIQKLDVNRDQGSFIINQAGKMPPGWEVVFVRKSVKKDCVVDLCPDCSDRYSAVHAGAQNAMDATVDAWLSSMVRRHEAEFEEKVKMSEEDQNETN